MRTTSAKLAAGRMRKGTHQSRSTPSRSNLLTILRMLATNTLRFAEFWTAFEKRAEPVQPPIEMRTLVLLPCA